MHLLDPSLSPIERHCAKCGKLLVILHYDRSLSVWNGTYVRKIKDGCSGYECRDCSEPDIPSTPAKAKPAAANTKVKPQRKGITLPPSQNKYK